MNKKSLLLALLVGWTLVGQAQTHTPSQPSAPARPAAEAPRAPKADRDPARVVPQQRPAAIPQLELQIPSGPGVICACVRGSGRA